MLECLPTYYQDANILDEKKYLAELCARLRQYRQGNNEEGIEDVLEEISYTKESIENPESVNIPPVCGAPSFNVMLAKGHSIDEFAETLYMETSHIDLYGWKGDGTTPTSTDNATYRILKSKCAWM